MKKYILMPRLQLLLLLAIFSFFFSACNKKSSKESNFNIYNEYITVFPERLISSSEKIQYQLKKIPNTTKINADVISVHPNVRGKISLKDNVLIFDPLESLENDKEYTVTLHLDKLYNNVHKNLKDFIVKFKTKKLVYNVSFEPVKVYNKDWYFVEGMLTVSDLIDSKMLSGLIKANYKGKSKDIKFETIGGYISKAYFKIDSLKRFDDDELLKVSWDGSQLKSTTTGEKELSITGKNNFKVLNVEVINGDNQHIEISFSDAIDKEQNLEGLIQFINTQKRKFTYKINKNTIYVFPSTEFKNTVEIEVFKGVKNGQGFKLKQNFIKKVYFEQIKPSVSFINSGIILPDSDNLKINFKAVNLRAVDATIYKIYEDNILQFLQNNNLNNNGNIRYVGRPLARYTVNLENKGLDLSKENAFAFNLTDFIKVDNGAMYRIEFSYLKEYSNYSCNGDIKNHTIVFGKKEVDTKKYDTNTFYYDNYQYGEYIWRDRDNPCTSSYFYNKKISTNILATNLGAIVKKSNNNKIFVAVTDILTTKPVSNAKVTLYNLQQQPITELVTNENGIVEIKGEYKAFFATIQKENNTIYIKLNEGNSLSMSKFDVSGVKLQKGLKGYIYGERGVWRPGDQLFLTFVLNDKENPIPQGHPITFELINPRGKIINRIVLQKNNSNLYAYSPKTEKEAITGIWKVKVKVGGANFYKNLKIETIKPNRLKIKMKLNNEIIKSNSSIIGNIKVNWLHGAIAKNLKFDITGKFTQSNTSFPKFTQYNFDDITKKIKTEEFKVLRGSLNNDGTSSFSVKPQLDNKAPGMLKASFISKVYENGGGFSTDVFSQKISPYKSYAGLLEAKEKQSRNYLFTDKKYTFNVAAVNENGNGIANDIEVKIYKLTWRWWWSSSENGLSNYDGTRHHLPFKTLSLKTNGSGKATFDLEIGESDWGRYLVKVIDKSSNHVTSSIVYFDWPSWYGDKKRNQDKTDATMLVFTSDKESYEINEIANLKFPSSEAGRALITIENGTEVLDHFWIETKAKQTAFSFPILENYTPNIFVNISLLQKHNQSINDLPIRMYGVIPIMVNDPSKNIVPQIELPYELRPETTAIIKVSEKEGRSMNYTIAVVDEGLLDLTRFKTPNPYKTFYARQSLGVKTWDVFDDVIGAYGGKVNQILSIGGDESEAGSKNKKANRFKPMVTYLGPFKLDKKGIGKHEIKIPKYIGSVRVMVIATDPDKEAYGSAEKSVYVRKPLMVLASLPRKITPQETVTLPVTIFAMKPSIKNVKVKVLPNESYSIIGNNSELISFKEPDEKMAYFTLKVNDFKGVGKVQVEATSGKEKANYEVEIDVLNPNPVTTEVKDFVLKDREEKEIILNSFGTTDTNTITIELSSLPPINFTERLDYLIKYPHGCVEQITSSAFPQLYFSDIFDLSLDKKEKIERNVKAAIQKLSNFQLLNGGFSYWKGNKRADYWGTSYVGHFLIEAAKKGYVLPIGFKNKWIHFQKEQSRKWRNNKDYANDDLSQAYRLYTLSLANSPDLASMNRLKEANDISNEAKLRLATSYALIGKHSIASSIITKNSKEKPNQNFYKNYGSKIRNEAMALETYMLLGDGFQEGKLVKKIVKALSSDIWMSTQTTAYSLFVISNYILKNKGNQGGIVVNYSLNGVSEEVNTSKSLFNKEIAIERKKNTISILNKGENTLYVRFLNKGVLPVGEEKAFKRNLKIDISYRTKNGERINPEEISQGTNFVAELTVKNETNFNINNVALTQYIPSGWEIINTRFTDFGNHTVSSKVNFTDIRDARVSHYFSLKEFEIKTFRVLLNASYLGNYYLPGAQVEAMYDNDFTTRVKGKWVKVIK